MVRKIPIEVSARHIHLSRKDLETLFGRGYQLRKRNDLTQPTDFAAKETVDICFSGKKISKVRVVGPERRRTQLEISWTDTYCLGIEVPVRVSGNLKGTPGIILIGPKEKLKIKEGVIIPWRHIHCSPKEAKELNLRKGMMVSVKTKRKRAITFHNVKIRLDKNFRPCMHLDTDEGNAAGIIKKEEGIII